MLSLKTFVLENWGLKLTAILLAMIMWLAVASEQMVRRVIFNVGLDFRNMPPDLEIVGPIAPRFDVEVETPIRKNILVSDLAIVIDLQGATEGTKVYPLGPESVRAPEGVEPIRVNPPRLLLVMERIMNKDVPVQPRLDGSLPAGFELGQVSVEPAGVAISGPRSRVNRVTNVSTEAIDLTSHTTSFTAAVTVLDEGASVHIDRIEPVQVSVGVTEKRRTVQVRDIPVIVEGGGNYSVHPARVQATVSVPMSLNETLRGDQFQAVIPVGALAPGVKEQRAAPKVTVRGPLAGTVQVVSVDPAEVRVRAQ